MEISMVYAKTALTRVKNCDTPRLQEFFVDPLVDSLLFCPDRVGGRIYTRRVKTNDGDKNFDMGAAYVSRSQTHIMDLLNDLKIETYPQYLKVRKNWLA